MNLPRVRMKEITNPGGRPSYNQFGIGFGFNDHLFWLSLDWGRRTYDLQFIFPPY